MASESIGVSVGCEEIARTLRARKRELEQELRKIETALALFVHEEPARKPRVSAETRQKMSTGQKRRWGSSEKASESSEVPK